MGLTLDPIEPFCVLVGSGQELICSHICRGVSLVMQGHLFSLDLFVLGLILFWGPMVERVRPSLDEL